MNKYKVVLSNNSIYKEISLNSDKQRVKVGTGIDCDIRLHKELFFDSIEIIFTTNSGEWFVYCSDNLYLSVGDVRKLMTKKLAHGDILEVYYRGADTLAFKIEFMIDFEDERKKYDRAIELSSATKITMGANPSFDICLSSEFVKLDDIELCKQNDVWVLMINQTTYGIYHNGKKAQAGERFVEGDFLSISDYSFYFKEDKLWTQKRQDLMIKGLRYNDKKVSDGYPKFNRSTRIRTVVNNEKIEILDPPSRPQKPKNDIFLRLLPSIGMILTAGIMAFLGGMMIAMSIISGIMAIITTIMAIREGNKDYKKALVEREKKYKIYIENKKKEIENARNQERIDLEEIYVSHQVEIERLNLFSSELFDRTRNDTDFLCVQLGTGDVLSQRQVQYKKQEKLEVEDELQQIPEEICEEFKYVHNAPVVCDFKAVNAVGIVGSLEYRFEMMKNIVIDLVARQYFSDLKMFFVVEEVHKEQIQWLRFLPYVNNDEEENISRNIVCDDESKKIVFEYLYKEFSRRTQEKKNLQNHTVSDSNIVIFFYDEYGFKSHPISKFVEKAKDIGVTFIFFGEFVEDIPQGCENIIAIKDKQNSVLINTQNRSEAVNFEYPHIETSIAREIVSILAPVYTEEISLESTLTKNITMFELLHVFSADEIDLEKNWKTSQVFKSMAAPIGVSTTGVVWLDLHDKAHGPHGLVAGTTGSGKSEILQTYILAMATLFHPYEVAFVIIDFKGGGMVNQFRKLPHLLGAITNIDGKEINRSLKSVKAELQKRQRLFAEAEVNHIDKYIKKYKKGEITVPLPHLIIIVDEFAELKAEQPDFMAELISAARIGRSLGVHLILATQKPAGQVDDQIWSNSRFKLCLKVQDQADSNEVLKSPVAAEIKEPGRAYLQVGNNEIFELFQSAYSGASEKTDDLNVKEFTIYTLTESGKRIPVFCQKRRKSNQDEQTQLDAIVQYISRYCMNLKIAKLSDICMPPLSTCMEYRLIQKSTSEHYTVKIGVYDDPDNQYQGEYTVALDNSNLIIIGSSQTGKTNMLQNIIRSLTDNYTPKEVNIYIIDFASMVLKNFEKLNHIGGVVCPSEDEKLKNLFKLLKAEIETRKQKLVSAGVSSFVAYREAGENNLPLIVLIIDNLRVLRELYFQEDDSEIMNLCREGLAVGICVIIANAGSGELQYRYLSNFSTKIALYCNESTEYANLFNGKYDRIDNIPGRCIVEVDKKCYECQSYLAFRGEKEIDRVQEIKKHIVKVNAAFKNSFAKRIPLVPDMLTKGFMIEQFGHYMENCFSIAVGLDYATVSPVVIDFATLGVLGITGREGAGRHNWIQYCVDMLDTMYSEMSKVYVVDDIGKRLSPLKEKKNVVAYSMIAEDAVSLIIEVEKQLKERYDALVSGDEIVLQKAELLMIIIENQDALDAICNNLDSLAAYQNIIGKYKNMKVCIIVFMENVNIPYMSPQILKDIRDQQKLIYFDDLSNMKIFDVYPSISRMFKKPIELGDGYYIRDNEYIKLKTPVSFHANRRK